MSDADILHEFRPRQDIDAQTDLVVSACACGWTGDRYPAGTEDYAEARDEYERHVSSAHEPEGLEVPADPPH